MKIQLVFALATVVLSVMADTKRSFNSTQALAKPAQARTPNKPTYLRTTPEERRKLTVFPKNTVKFIATTKAPPPPKKFDNESRRKHSVLLPKMSKQVRVSTVDTNTQPTFKATTMYNFKPTRAPKVGRFSNKRLTTTTTSAPFKPHAYKKDLYKRIEKDFVSKKANPPATLPRKHEFNDEASHEDSRPIKNKFYNVEQEDGSNEENEEELSKEEESYSRELEEVDEEPLESRIIDQGIDMDVEPLEVLKRKSEGTTEKTTTKEKDFLGQGNIIKEEKHEMKPTSVDEESANMTKSLADRQEQFAILREKRNNLTQGAAHSYKIGKRSVIEEENLAPTVAGIKYTGIEPTLSDNSGFKNVNV